jgi:GNAT superfamily N-acetyltransferase
MCINTNGCRTREQGGTCNCGGHGRAATGGLHLRMANPDDVPTLLALVGELAAFENLSHELEANAMRFTEYLFGSRPRASVIMADYDGKPAGFAVWYPTYSTFTGQPGAFLEDLYVRPDFRRKGIGRALLAGVSGEARAVGCARLEWRALKWNEPALAFYQSLGAAPISEWVTLRLDEPKLSAL